MESREQLTDIRDQLLAKYESAKAKADELHKAVEGIEAALRHLGGPGGRGRIRRGHLVQALQPIVESKQGPFTVHDVEDALAKRDPELGDKTGRATLSRTLGRLVGQGLLIVVEQGSGKRATKYERKMAANRQVVAPLA